MVQRGLLTVNPGSIHGGGEAPGGDSSLRQGAGKRCSGAPDLGSATAAEQRRDREKGFPVSGFCEGGQPGGPAGVQAAPWRGPTLGRAGRAPGALVGPLWPPSMIPEASCTLIFYWIFLEFLEHFLYGGNLK